MHLARKASKGSFLAVALLFPLATPAVADDVVEQIEMGLELYQVEEYGAAIAELEFAISDLRELMSERIGETFPEAPAGWSAGDIQSTGGSGAGAAAIFGGGSGVMLERSYREQNGNGTITASLAVDNPMVQGMATMFSNPALMAAQPNMERVRIGRENAMVKWEPQRSRAEATLLVDGRILMQVTGLNLDSRDRVVELMQNWNLAQVRETTAR